MWTFYRSSRRSKKSLNVDTSTNGQRVTITTCNDFLSSFPSSFHPSILLSFLPSLFLFFLNFLPLLFFLSFFHVIAISFSKSFLVFEIPRHIEPLSFVYTFTFISWIVRVIVFYEFVISNFVRTRFYSSLMRFLIRNRTILNLIYTFFKETEKKIKRFPILLISFALTIIFVFRKIISGLNYVRWELQVETNFLTISLSFFSLKMR